MDEFYEKLLKKLSHELRTQDNRITGEPLFCVQQKRRIWGIDTRSDPETAWIWKDDPDCVFDTKEEAMKDFLCTDYDKKHFDKYIEEVGYIDIWEFKTAHLTETAAQLYIDQNKHNLTSPRIFVTSQYRCHEFNEVVEYIKGIE